MTYLTDPASEAGDERSRHGRRRRKSLIAWLVPPVVVAVAAGIAGFWGSLQVGRWIARSAQQALQPAGEPLIGQLPLARQLASSDVEAGRSLGSVATLTAEGLATGRAVPPGLLGTTNIRTAIAAGQPVGEAASEPPSKTQTEGAMQLDELFGSEPEKAPGDVEQLVAEARQVAQRVVQAFPNRADSHEVAARLYFLLGETEQAAASWERCLKLDSNYAYAYHGLGSVAANRGELEEAVAWYRRALLANPSLPDTQVELARILIDLNKLQEAIDVLEKNVAADPRPYRGRVLLGMAYMQLEDYQKAKENYEAAVAAHPKHANAHFGLATVCARLGQEELSRTYMEKFRELRAEEHEIGARERTSFDDLKAMSIEAARIYTDAARICRALGDLADMERLCRRAAAMDAGNVDCLQALAWFHLHRGEIDRTIEQLERLAVLDPTNIDYPAEIARLYAATNRPDQADRRLRQACQADPKNPAAFAVLARFLLQQPAKTDEAVRAAATAVELSPTAPYYALLGAAQQKKGNLAEARKALAEAVRLAPDDLQYKQMYELLDDRGENDR